TALAPVSGPVRAGAAPPAARLVHGSPLGRNCKWPQRNCGAVRACHRSFITDAHGCAAADARGKPGLTKAKASRRRSRIVMMKRYLGVGLAACAALAMTGLSAQAQRTQLTVYTALENDQLGPFKAAIEKAIPEVEVVWVRDSTGAITARFLAEKDNPRADMVLGIAASSLLMFEKEGLLETYKPKGADDLKPVFRDREESYTWTGMDAYLGVICFNTAEAGNIPVPTSWKDLTKPEFKGKLAMPHPASSGTGYLTVGAWLQTIGEEEGWKFMDALHENMAVYTHSGSAPCVQAAKGER